MNMRIIKTKIVKESKEKKLIVGIDVGATTHYGYCKFKNYETKVFTFSNSYKGFEKLLNIIEQIMNEHKIKINEVIIGLESTGSYGEPRAIAF